MKWFFAYFEKSLILERTFFAAVIILLLGAGAIEFKLIAESKHEAIKTATDANQEDDSGTFEQFRQNAEKGIPAAQYELSIMYASGSGTGKDEAKADKWCQKAARAGYTDAQAELGYKYYTGSGGTAAPDYAKAAEWYLKAAEAGHTEARHKIGIMYLHGEGVTQDDVKAFEFIQKAAEAGYRISKSKLGWMYEHGRGVAQDKAKAAEWYHSVSHQNGLYR
ncbi:MAG: tetratricopeptide repeat protein [Victivallaceae bacterium]|jgi:hypothetical protein